MNVDQLVLSMLCDGIGCNASIKTVMKVTETEFSSKRTYWWYRLVKM